MSTVDRRLHELAERYALDACAVDALRSLLHAVATDDAAPTTVRAPDQAVDVHIADSLAGLEVDAITTAERIADIGAGAGFPGLVLAAALPQTRVIEVESAGRKCAFMRRAAAAAGLRNAEVVHARVEEWRAGMGACDAVTARAVAPLAVLAEYAAPLLRLGGVLVAWKGARNAEEERAGEAAARQLGLAGATVVPVRPWEDVEARDLHLYSKVTETPPRFPRRPGMARKRPLGGSS